MAYRTRSTVIATVLAALAASLVVLPASPVEASTLSRIAGPTRIETAIAVARKGWPTAGTVVLARADDPADALAGSALAASLDAPLLVTPPSSLVPDVAATIRALGADRAVLLGGERALAPKVAHGLRAAGVSRIERVAGPNRYATAAAVAARLGSADTALLVGDWRSALASAGLSARRTAAGDPWPIVLTGAELAPEATRALAAMGARRVVIVGDSVPRAADEQLRRAGYEIDRLSGAGPINLNLALLKRDPAPAAGLLVATGRAFPDGLSAGAFAARRDANLMLVGSSLTDAQRSWLSDGTGERLTVIGGESAVDPSVADALAALANGRKLSAKKPRTDSPSDPTTETPTDAGGRHWGLHHSPAEVAAWRARTTAGPYRTTGDAGPNTPGDWERIEKHAERFRSAPTASLWRGPAGDLGTCVQKGDAAPPVDPADHLRDAAFRALVTADTRDLAAIKAALLAQAREPGTDFTNAKRWCAGVLIDASPSFPIAHWMTKLLFTYDYLGPAAFTAAERATLDAWFLGGARFLRQDIDKGLGDLFVDRSGTDMTLSATVAKYPGCGKSMYAGGPDTCQINRVYNNRRSAIARFVALVGVHQGDAALRDFGSRYVREAITFSVYSAGAYADMQRWEDRNPDLGWAYAVNALAAVGHIADAFARSGDPSLYGFVTSGGAFGSEGGAKDLRFAARAMGRYVTGKVERYATDDPARVGDPATRIDARNGDWESVHDVSFALLNVYLQDAEIRSVYTRTAPGLRGYPARPATSGPSPIWMGEGGVFPGVLFQFAGMEGKVDPYP